MIIGLSTCRGVKLYAHFRHHSSGVRPWGTIIAQDILLGNRLSWVNRSSCSLWFHIDKTIDFYNALEIEPKKFWLRKELQTLAQNALQKLQFNFEQQSGKDDSRSVYIWVLSATRISWSIPSANLYTLRHDMNLCWVSLAICERMMLRHLFERIFASADKKIWE